MKVIVGRFADAMSLRNAPNMAVPPSFCAAQRGGMRCSSATTRDGSSIVLVPAVIDLHIGAAITDVHTADRSDCVIEAGDPAAAGIRIGLAVRCEIDFDHHIHSPWSHRQIDFGLCGERRDVFGVVLEEIARHIDDDLGRVPAR